MQAEFLLGGASFGARKPFLQLRSVCFVCRAALIDYTHDFREDRTGDRIMTIFYRSDPRSFLKSDQSVRNAKAVPRFAPNPGKPLRRITFFPRKGDVGDPSIGCVLAALKRRSEAAARENDGHLFLRYDYILHA